MPTQVVPSSITAALVPQPGRVPRTGVVDLPALEPGRTLLRVEAAPLNPVDLVMASGAVPWMRHERPYVPGIECVGTVVVSDTWSPGNRVYAETRPAPDRPGAMATHVVVDDHDAVALPKDVDSVRGAAIGNAGCAAFQPLVELGRLMAGDTVLVLGATGAVGRLAIQIAAAHGAGRIVGVGRDPAALTGLTALGADAVVALDENTSGEDTSRAATGTGPMPGMTKELQAAVGEPGAQVVLDGLWGTPLLAALPVCAPGARVVNIGNPAGAEITLPAGLLRSRQLTLAGYASVLTPLASKLPALRFLWSGIASGSIEVDVETLPLAEITRAWEEQANSPHRKLVLT